MFWVTTPGDLPVRYSEARAWCPRPGFAVPKCASIAKRRRQDSSRASWLARKSEKSIGRILVQMPPGERKSGMPHSVDIPAPVNGTITSDSSTSSRKRAMAVFTSGAIMYSGPDGSGTTKNEVNHEISAHHAARAQSRRRASFLCGPAGSERGAPAGGRQEQIHTGVPLCAGGRGAGRGEQEKDRP